MGRKRIGVDEVATVLEELAGEFTDRVDPRSQTAHQRYVSCGQATCLVAVALERLGFSPASIATLDQEAKGRPVAFVDSKSAVAQRFTHQARELLDTAQRFQDSGDTWSRAVHWALRRHPRT